MPAMTMPLDCRGLLNLIGEAVCQYEHSAPAVSTYLDALYVAASEATETVTLAEILAVQALRDGGQWEQPNYAANRFYKLANRLGKDTTGLAGF